jgi:hypothetical protein
VLAALLQLNTFYKKFYFIFSAGLARMTLSCFILEEIVLPHLTTSPVTQPAEHLHSNAVRISGTITKIWLQDQNILCKLKSITGDKPNYLTLFFPDGKPAAGQPISLAPNLRLLVTGFLRNMDYKESYAQVLQREGWPKLIEPGDEAIVVKQSTTQLVVETCEAAPVDDLNEASLSGIVAKVWRRPHLADVYASLAVYDAHTTITDESARRGLPRRIAHYVRLAFPGGVTTDGLKVNLEPRRLVIVSGSIINADYSEPLAKFLQQANRSDRLTEQVTNRRIGRSMTRVIGSRLIVLSGKV